MTNDKIPIGIATTAGPDFGYHVRIKLKPSVKFLKPGDIITLDMIEPYESVAVRKVADYLSGCMDSPIGVEYKKEHWIQHAKEIIALVHEAEDADE